MSDQDKILKALERIPRCRGMTESTRKYGGVWVYGHAWTTNFNTQEHVVYTDGEPRAHIIQENGIISVVDPETVGQYIRQKDDDGIDIYEGDWVLCDRYSTHERFEVLVESIKAIPSLMFGSSLNCTKVVGNKYETRPEGEGDGKN